VCTALQLAGGKLLAAPAVAHALPSPSGAPLIYLKDRPTHTSYLVDTGAAVSLLPYSSPLYPSGPTVILLMLVVKKFHLAILYRKKCILALILLHKIFFASKSKPTHFWALIFFQRILILLIVTKAG
jgi:hypothetical protein